MTTYVRVRSTFAWRQADGTWHVYKPRRMPGADYEDVCIAVMVGTDRTAEAVCQALDRQRIPAECLLNSPPGPVPPERRGTGDRREPRDGATR